MAVLHIHYSVPDYERWKRAFDRDVTNRHGSGVLRYRIQRVVLDPSLVMVDLELNSRQEAEALLVKMRRVWDVNGFTANSIPESWIGESVESVELSQEPEGVAMSDVEEGHGQEREPKPIGKPSQAEGEDDDGGEQHEVKSPSGKPSQAEGDVGDSDAGQE